MARILAIDIETRPALVLTFDTYRPYISPEQIVESSRIFCFSWQWEDDKKVSFMSEWEHGRDDMLAKLHELFDEADIVMGYNTKSFDTRWIEGELLRGGYTPPSPFQQIDLYRVVKQHSRFLSNKLSYVAPHLLEESKVTHSGFILWRQCMEGDTKAQATMKRYALQDTRLMFPLYHLLRPWIANHPNLAAIDGKPFACPNCSSENVQKRGFRTKGLSKYQQYHCQNCGAWKTDGVALARTALR